MCLLADPSVSQDGSTDAIAYAAATGMPLDFSAIASLGYSIPGSARVSGNGGPTPQLGHAGMGGVGAFTLNDVLAMYDGDALAGVKKLRSADQSCAGDSPSKRLDALAGRRRGLSHALINARCRQQCRAHRCVTAS